ncbi:hypothetical protein B0I35DRAFT_431492 [Stachybotrys elegans]|uniref:CID domain-containing protein n=1 Tax=Stachybotrys elegans TaxID=80388 RepID=A0A8K0SUR2_9HYPO|nr:hypothetical protein B0I35DRAFT_431492 [Stachybotrys elegans]
MAAPELAIAKAALSASLFRSDPTSLSRPAVDALFPLLSSTLVQCSRPNVQKSRAWIAQNVAHSTTRTAALAKYLLALSKNQQDDGTRPSVKRRRLHILYLLNDVLFHAVTGSGDAHTARALEPMLPMLVASAAAFDKCPKHVRKLQDLVALWEEKKYFPDEVVSQLKDAIVGGPSNPSTLDLQPSAASIKLARDAPYLLPSFHGDTSTPWYDLPAATWLPHLTPNSTKPMFPDLIRPIQLAPGPADKALTSAVQNLLADVDKIFSREVKLDEDEQVDIDELGERVILDEITGEAVGGDTYYGWSRQFCAKMKERARKSAAPASPRGRSRSRSGSPSFNSVSPPAIKRRRLSESRSRSRNRSPDRRRERSYSRSRSRDRRRSYSRSRSPPAAIGFQSRSVDDHRTPSNQPYPPPPHNMPPMPPAGAFQHHPPPSGYTGPWPPPPPPPMGGPQGNWFPNPGMMPPHIMPGWIPPPPPPVPQPDQYGYSRGNGGFRGRGRGGYGRGY